MNIGQIIKMEREKRYLSMNALAKRSGASQSAISEIESGKRQPTFEVLEKIIVAGFDMTLYEFFYNDKQDLTQLPPDIWDLVKDSNNYNMLRLIIALKAEGISNDLIYEMIKSISNTLRAAKKEGVYWAADKVTEEQKDKAERFIRKIRKLDLTPDEDK